MPSQGLPQQPGVVDGEATVTATSTMPTQGDCVPRSQQVQLREHGLAPRLSLSRSEKIKSGPLSGSGVEKCRGAPGKSSGIWKCIGSEGMMKDYRELTKLVPPVHASYAALVSEEAVDMGGWNLPRPCWTLASVCFSISF